MGKLIKACFIPLMKLVFLASKLTIASAGTFGVALLFQSHDGQNNSCRVTETSIANFLDCLFFPTVKQAINAAFNL